MDRRIWVFLYTLTLLHVARFIHCVEASICYDQDGTPNSNTPCTTGGNDTFCCSDGYYCLSNGLCEGRMGLFGREHARIRPVSSTVALYRELSSKLKAVH